MIPVPIIGAWLVRRLLARKPALTAAHAERQAAVISWAIILALAIAGWLVFDHFNDRAAVATREARRVEAALEGERRASSADADRQAQIEAASRSTTERLEQIHDADPEAAARPASAGSRAVADRLRPR